MTRMYHRPLCSTERSSTQRGRGSKPALAVAGLALALAACGSANPSRTAASPQATSEPPQATPSPPLPPDPGIETGTLPNGLTYYIERHRVGDGRLHLALAVRVGSLVEGDEERGLAHFVEHMAFNGTERFEKQSLVDLFERAGMTMGSDLNASTGQDRTLYRLNVPTEDPALTATALDVLRDWASAVRFEPEDVEEERGVVLAEWRSGRGAGQRAWDRQTQLLFAGSRFAERDPIGVPEVIESAAPKLLSEFYRRWYQPRHMAVIAVGDVEPKALRDETERRFSDLTNTEGRGDLPQFARPALEGMKLGVFEDEELATSRVSVQLLGDARPIRTEADLLDQLVDETQGFLLGRRLQNRLLAGEAPYTHATAYASSDAFGAFHLLELEAASPATKAGDTLAVLAEEVQRAL